MAEPFLGEIRMFGFNFNPRGWAQCNGQLLPIAQNTALFSLLGTIYGGDGRTTFALPELRGRFPMHYGNGPGLTGRPIGQRSGTEDVTLVTSQIPSHTHAATVTADVGDATSPVGTIPATANDGESNYRNSGSGTTLAAGTQGQASGGGQSHTNMPPYLAVNFCIALTGIFPSRS